ncbi:hypothetical protein [Sphingomonas sp. BK580]|uniref:hypothetical protein n=1 Tax=Sphingomonas sp. BK580 TaxID=2586972 RepID=UPI00161822FD|nr:hypothetical protein [Sphingomonas sp. BK580]MBB3691444.1 hypothetical protein [Sphingomonas sp. BK580]
MAPAAARAPWKDLIPVLTIMLTIVGMLVAGGKMLGKLDDNTRRIEKLEVRADTSSVEQSDMKANLAAINAKLDLLIRRTPERP